MHRFSATLLALAIVCSVPLGYIAYAADIQVNTPDHNARDLSNCTTQSETSVAVSDSLVVVGYNTSKQAGLLGPGGLRSTSGFAYSYDGGATFADGGFVPWGTGNLAGDPSLAFDLAGNLYYASIGAIADGTSVIQVNKSNSTSTAVSFDDPVSIMGVQSFTFQGTTFYSGSQDQPKLAVDTQLGSNYYGRVYVAWTEFENLDSQNGRILFAASSSTSSLAFSPVVPLTPNLGLGYQGAMPAVGPSGEVYVVWGQFTPNVINSPQLIHIVKSADGGVTLINPNQFDSAPDKTVAVMTSAVENMSNSAAGEPNVKTRGFPSIAVDRTSTSSPTRGNVYIVFHAKPPAPSTARSEIFFTRSTDGGATWSPPRDISSGAAVTIGADTTANDNWFPSIAVSPTGHISVIFYSRREDPENKKIRVYQAGSTDDGRTWFNRPFSGTAFTPNTGYDCVFKPDYMGDYLHVSAEGSSFRAAWGDVRNTCAPPAGASAPCWPAGRGDQDVFFATEADPTGADLFITPWGRVTGSGPTWQSPDIYAVDTAGNVINAQKGVVNALRGRVRNLGNLAASGAVVRFRYAPIFVNLPDSALKEIAAPSLDFAQAGDGSGNDLKVVPVEWDLIDTTDTNGNQWPAPISAFDHFCVKVSIEYPGDINLSNNKAQNNFFDVSTASPPPSPSPRIRPEPSGGPMGFRFLVGNPFDRQIRARLVTGSLPAGYAIRLEGLPPGNALTLRPREIRVAAIRIIRPRDVDTQRRTQDVVASVSMGADGKMVGGLSLRLARANTKATAPSVVPRKPLRAQGSPQPRVSNGPPPPPIESTVVGTPDAAMRAALQVLRARQYPVVQNDGRRGLVSSGAVMLNVAQIKQAVPARFTTNLSAGTKARYFVSIHVEPAAPQGSRITVSARIIIENPFADGPLGGSLVLSNGVFERQILGAVVQRLGAVR